MIPYSQMCNVCNACNASRYFAASHCCCQFFLGKCLFFQEKFRKKQCEYKPPDALSKIVANAAVERGSLCGQSNADIICCQRTIRESQQTAAISLQASSEQCERYKQCSNAFAAALFSHKQRQSVTNVTNVTHFRVRIPRYKQQAKRCVTHFRVRVSTFAEKTTAYSIQKK